ncbi:MAG: helix-hairpin-helix domain-containing protein [Candidatus Omnitrophica bacterium]|nr:helix-hairpin-helix domain-containing protein [Candidatus Omnitrophota bacterium]
MISYICGKLVEKRDLSVLLELNGISYEIMVPPAIMSTIETNIQTDGSLRLVTYHYHQVDQSRSLPMLIGFLNEIEKDFFEQFITVSGIGPKAACRAMSMPFSVIADAIDRGDLVLLKTLPGIGEQRAREIVAKLQGKVARFALIQDRNVVVPKVKEDIRQEALSVLLQLQYKKKEAEDMLDAAVARNPEVKSCEDIV